MRSHCEDPIDSGGRGLNGTLESAELKPEGEVNLGCDTFVADTSQARLTEYISDIFTTEDHLLDSVGLLGPTATNIAITPQLQFYRSGVYFNEAECVSYAEEPVPPECREVRAGRLSYTCLTKASQHYIYMYSLSLSISASLCLSLSLV